MQQWFLSWACGSTQASATGINRLFLVCLGFFFVLVAINSLLAWLILCFSSKLSSCKLFFSGRLSAPWRLVDFGEGHDQWKVTAQWCLVSQGLGQRIQSPALPPLPLESHLHRRDVLRGVAPLQLHWLFLPQPRVFWWQCTADDKFQTLSSSRLTTVGSLFSRHKTRRWLGIFSTGLPRASHAWLTQLLSVMGWLVLWTRGEQGMLFSLL